VSRGASRNRKAKNRGARKGRGRGWATFLLFVLLGFFGLSIVLGRLQASSSERDDARERVRPTSLADPPAPIVPDAHSPTLIVWNGCGRPGLAAKVAGWLRRQGFDVFETGNADRSDYRETLVVQRSHRAEAGKKVAARLEERLGIGFLITQRPEVPEADVLLILGRDFPDSLPTY
jgi:hypothetical protein